MCRCGNTGFLEALAGGAALARDGAAAARDGRSPVLAQWGHIDAGDLAWTAQKRDHVAANLLDPGIHDVVHRGIHRVLGTLTGLVATALLLAPDPGSTVLAVLVIVLLFPTELFMMRHYGIALGFFTPLIMLMTQLADPSDPLTMLTDRGIDTLIGVAAGIAMAVLVRRPKLRSSRDWPHRSTAFRT